jgi:hypothetical protein
VSIAVEAFGSTAVAAEVDESVASGAGAGGVAAAGGVLLAGGVSRNDAGSMPTLLETTPVEPVAADEVPPNEVGSTPTELVTTGGDGALDAAGDEDAPGRIDIEFEDAAGAGGVTLRLSFTTGTRIFRVSAVAADCAACPFEVLAGCLKTRGAADACAFDAFAGAAAAGTRNTGKRRGTTLRECRECTRAGGARRAAMMNGAAYTYRRAREQNATPSRAIFATRSPISPSRYDGSTTAALLAMMTRFPLVSRNIRRCLRSLGSELSRVAG